MKLGIYNQKEDHKKLDFDLIISDYGNIYINAIDNEGDEWNVLTLKLKDDKVYLQRETDLPSDMFLTDGKDEQIQVID